MRKRLVSVSTLANIQTLAMFYVFDTPSSFQFEDVLYHLHKVFTVCQIVFLEKRTPKIGRLQITRVLEDFKNTFPTSANV